jgi:hypothetical protein
MEAKKKRSCLLAGSVLRRGRQTNPSQREVLRDVMLSAANCNAWLTLEQLTRMTNYPQASISAQLRHLRKEQHGGYRVAKRCRPAAAGFLRGVDDRSLHGPVWEYRLGCDGETTIRGDVRRSAGGAVYVGA